MIIGLLRNIIKLKSKERFSRDKLTSVNLKSFRKLVKFAYKNSRYYKNLIDDKKIDIKKCSPLDFPTLTKDALIKNFDDIVTDPIITKENLAEFLKSSIDPNDLFKGRYHVLHTSGTSGQIGYFVFSKKEWITGFSKSARIHSIGFRKKLAYIAATKGHFAGISLISYGKSGMNRLFYNIKTFDINGQFHEIISNLNTFQPEIIAGYSKALVMLARAKESGELKIFPKMIESGGEPLFSEDKEYLEKVFNASVINVYAASEHLIMGIGKNEYGGMYLMEDDLIFEFGKDHVCVTNLFNKTMPLIRYRMNDVITPIKDDLNVLPFTKIKDLVGRNEYMPEFINKYGKMDFIHPIVFVEFFVPNLEHFQIKLVNNHTFIFYALIKKDLLTKDRLNTINQIKKKLNNILNEKEMQNVSFKIQEVRELKVDQKSGKFRLIVK